MMLAFALAALLPFVAAAPVDATTTAGPTNPPPPPTYPATFKGTELHPHDREGNIIVTKCLDVKGADFSNGTPVQM